MRGDEDEDGVHRDVRAFKTSSMRPGVLDAVLGELPVALLLAVADAELEVGIVLVAAAAFGADARAALGRGRERSGKPLAA